MLKLPLTVGAVGTVGVLHFAFRRLAASTEHNVQNTKSKILTVCFMLLNYAVKMGWWL